MFLNSIGISPDNFDLNQRSVAFYERFQELCFSWKWKPQSLQRHYFDRMFVSHRNFFVLLQRLGLLRKYMKWHTLNASNAHEYLNLMRDEKYLSSSNYIFLVVHAKTFAWI
jgi:hypothetical protein